MNAAGAPKFLTREQVTALHRKLLEEHGGLDGVRDLGAIESVLMAAQNVWFYSEADLYEIAAAYAYHLAQAQAFYDGNKRVAVASAFTFLDLNHCADVADDEAIYSAMIAIAEHRMDRAGLAKVLRMQFPLK